VPPEGPRTHVAELVSLGIKAARCRGPRRSQRDGHAALEAQTRPRPGAPEPEEALMPSTQSYDDSREEAAMADPVVDIIGDYRAFAAQQRDRLLARGIDIRPYALSHLAVRVPEWDQYVHVRTCSNATRSPIVRTSGTAARSP
jgi:hypothetical protein